MTRHRHVIMYLLCIILRRDTSSSLWIQIAERKLSLFGETAEQNQQNVCIQYLFVGF